MVQLRAQGLHVVRLALVLARDLLLALLFALHVAFGGFGKSGGVAVFLAGVLGAHAGGQIGFALEELDVLVLISADRREAC